MKSQGDDPHGAVSACAEADRGEVRRPTRLVERAGVLAQPPTAARPDACGDGARRTAAYRFVAHAASAPQDCRASPSEATDRRVNQVPIVWAGQDPPAVAWTSHPAPQGVGPLGPTACQGLLVHRPRAFTPARVPRGRLAQPVGARDPGASRGPSASRNASHGSPVWRPSAAHPRGVPRPGWSALATVTPRSTPCGRPSVRRVSRW